MAKKQNTFEKRRGETDKKLKSQEKRQKREARKLSGATKPSSTNSMEQPNPENSEAHDE